MLLRLRFFHSFSVFSQSLMLHLICSALFFLSINLFTYQFVTITKDAKDIYFPFLFWFDVRVVARCFALTVALILLLVCVAISYYHRRCQLNWKLGKSLFFLPLCSFACIHFTLLSFGFILILIFRYRKSAHSTNTHPPIHTYPSMKYHSTWIWI